MPIQKQKIFLISGIALGIMAILLTKAYLDQQRQLAQAAAKKTLANIQANQTAVLVAKQDIPKGVAIDVAMLETAVIPNQYVAPRAATSLDRVADMITTAAISKGEQVTLTKLAYTKQAGGGDLAGLTPSGKRAVTISVDNISSLAGMIRPGDFVDVIAIIPIPIQTAEGKTASQLGVLPLFQNVLVLAVGQQTGAMARDESRYQKQEAGPSPLITLALGPQETSLIAFVQEQGKIRLVLRSPQDNQVQNVPPANWDTLFRYIMPPRESTVEAEVPTVEIYRGLQKERVPLSN